MINCKSKHTDVSMENSNSLFGWEINALSMRSYTLTIDTSIAKANTSPTMRQKNFL